MKKDLFKIIIFFLITIGFVYLALNFIFFNKQAPTSKAGGETMELIYEPRSVTSTINSDFTVVFKIKPSVNLTLRGYSIRLIFDGTKLNVGKIDYKLGQVSAGLGDTNDTLNIVNKTGILSIIGEIPTPIGKVINSNESTELVSLTFKVLSETETSFEIKTSDAVFFAFNSDMVLFEVPLLKAVKFNVPGGGVLLVSPAITQPTGNVKINTKLKFQGITKRPVVNNVIDVKAKISGCNLSSPKETVGRFTADDNGIWSGTFVFDLNPCANYILYIKGPHHLQKKVCDPSPSESSFGTYRCLQGKLDIKSGQNNFDFSKILFLAGDLDQNGVTDSVDISLIRNNLGKTDQSILSKADINHDGRVDTQDFSLVIAALSVKVDEM